MNKNNFNAKCIAQMALLIALEIILSRFVSIPTPIVKISFSFLAIVTMAMLYGPVYAAAGAALADFLGAILIPFGAYFPGFTLTAALTGAVYGLMLYKKEASFFRMLLAAVLVNVVLQMGLDTVWLVMMTGKGFLALLPIRAIKCILMIPIQMVGIKAMQVFLRTSHRLSPIA